MCRYRGYTDAGTNNNRKKVVLELCAPCIHEAQTGDSRFTDLNIALKFFELDLSLLLTYLLHLLHAIFLGHDA